MTEVPQATAREEARETERVVEVIGSLWASMIGILGQATDSNGVTR